MLDISPRKNKIINESNKTFRDFRECFRVTKVEEKRPRTRLPLKQKQNKVEWRNIPSALSTQSTFKSAENRLLLIARNSKDQDDKKKRKNSFKIQKVRELKNKFLDNFAEVFFFRVIERERNKITEGWSKLLALLLCRDHLDIKVNDKLLVCVYVHTALIWKYF